MRLVQFADLPYIVTLCAGLLRFVVANACVRVVTLAAVEPCRTLLIAVSAVRGGEGSSGAEAEGDSEEVGVHGWEGVWFGCGCVGLGLKVK